MFHNPLAACPSLSSLSPAAWPSSSWPCPTHGPQSRVHLYASLASSRRCPRTSGRCARPWRTPINWRRRWSPTSTTRHPVSESGPDNYLKITYQLLCLLQLWWPTLMTCWRTTTSERMSITSSCVSENVVKDIFLQGHPEHHLVPTWDNDTGPWPQAAESFLFTQKAQHYFDVFSIIM